MLVTPEMLEALASIKQDNEDVLNRIKLASEASQKINEEKYTRDE